MLVSAKKIGERFEEERERLGYKRSEFAHASGYSPEQIRKVEKGEQIPGGALLAAMLALHGRIDYILGSDSPQSEVRNRSIEDGIRTPTMDEMSQAMQREEIRREAREHNRMRSDRRKKVLTDDEADLIEIYRDLSRVDREKLIDQAKLLLSGVDSSKPAGIVISNVKGGRVAGRDFIQGSIKPKKKV